MSDSEKSMEMSLIITKLEASLISVIRTTSKLEENLTKLTEVSADVNKILAVQELRINNIEEDLQNSYSQLTDELEEAAQAGIERSDKLMARLQKIERFVWIISGGGMVMGFILARTIPNLGHMIFG